MIEDELGEIRDELKEYKKQLDALKNDLEVIIQMANLRYAIGLPSTNNPDPVSSLTHEGRFWLQVHRTGAECAEFIVHVCRHRIVQPRNDAKLYSDPSHVCL